MSKPLILPSIVMKAKIVFVLARQAKVHQEDITASFVQQQVLSLDVVVSVASTVDVL